MRNLETFDTLYDDEGFHLLLNWLYQIENDDICKKRFHYSWWDLQLQKRAHG